MSKKGVFIGETRVQEFGGKRMKNGQAPGAKSKIPNSNFFSKSSQGRGKSCCLYENSTKFPQNPDEGGSVDGFDRSPRLSRATWLNLEATRTSLRLQSPSSLHKDST
ncbi:hypothetical protein AABB24_002627, partial [Solanum stoloniferum]